jgi:hypothetical protein
MRRSELQKDEGAWGLPPLSAVGWFVESRMRDGRFDPARATQLAGDTAHAEHAPPRRSNLIRSGSGLIWLRDRAIAATRALGFARVLGSRPAQEK